MPELDPHFPRPPLPAASPPGLGGGSAAALREALGHYAHDAPVVPRRAATPADLPPPPNVQLRDPTAAWPEPRPPQVRQPLPLPERTSDRRPADDPVQVQPSATGGQVDVQVATIGRGGNGMDFHVGVGADLTPRPDPSQRSANDRVQDGVDATATGPANAARQDPGGQQAIAAQQAQMSVPEYVRRATGAPPPPLDPTAAPSLPGIRQAMHPEDMPREAAADMDRWLHPTALRRPTRRRPF